MTGAAPALLPSRRTIGATLARAAYRRDEVRLTGASIDGCDCLVASRQGLFGVGRNGTVTKVAHGFFFGIRKFADGILAFEACDRPYARSEMGRLLHLHWNGGRLSEATILVKGIDNQCHQVAAFDDSIWVVETAHQAILQFSPAGALRMRHTPFPVAVEDREDHYLHINGIAALGERIAVMLHNGTTLPRQPSALAWLDRRCTMIERVALPGYGCHDIVSDADGRLWHCDSMAGDVFSSGGDRVSITDRMTRGLAVTADLIVVGVSDFARRDGRDAASGSLVYHSRARAERTEVMLPGAPTDLVML